MHIINPKKALIALQKNSKFVICCLIIGISIGFLYSVLVFKPVFCSKAEILIKQKTQKGKEEPVQNILATQMEILKSESLAESVWNKIKDKHKLNYNDKNGIEKIRRSIKLKNPSNTNIINVFASWTKPEIARDIASETISAYMNKISDLQKQGYSREIKLLEKNLEKKEKELLQVRKKIKEYKTNNSIIDFDTDLKNISKKISTLENKHQELMITAATEAYKIKSAAKILGIKNYNLNTPGVFLETKNLSSKLENLQDKMAGLSSKYTEIHPEIKNIKSRISRLETQIEDRLKLSLGKNTDNNEEIISSPAGKYLMEVLISSKKKYGEIQLQSNEIKNRLNLLKNKRKQIPENQYALTNYKQKETVLAETLNILNANKAELEFFKSTIPVRISLVDNPVIPQAPLFPNRFELVIMFMMFFGSVGLKIAFAKDFFKNSYNTAEEMEKDLKTDVLGVIPWLKQDMHDDTYILEAIDETASFYSLAYQKTISGLKIKGSFDETKALSFTSSEYTKNRSTIIMNLAYSLSRTGQSVIVVDADFRTPSVGKEMDFEVCPHYSLTELLSVINKEIKQKGDFDENKINMFIRSIPNVDNFYMLQNSGNVPDPCEFLYSESFRQLIITLKKKYDWVFIDTPPALAVPDAFMTGLYVDGTVIITGLETSKSNLKKIHKQFKNYNINIFGIIARDYQKEEAFFSSKYIKLMIERLMIKKERALT